MTARTLDREFTDLVLSDPELLRAEFDAIIGEGWDEPPPVPAPRPPPVDGAVLPRPVSGAPPDVEVTPAAARQRSPPATRPGLSHLGSSRLGSTRLRGR